jgi:serine/threonine protein kinase
LLLDSEFNLKIGDFGFAGPLEGRDGTGLLRTRLGTLNYMAPEVHQNQAY